MDADTTGGDLIEDVENNERSEDPLSEQINPPKIEKSSAAKAGELYFLPSGHREIGHCAARIFQKLAKLGLVYKQGSKIVRPSKINGSWEIEQVSPSMFRSICEKVGQLIRDAVDNKGKPIFRPSRCSEDQAKAMIVADEALEPSPPLENIAKAGVLVVGKDKKAHLLKPGYDPHSRLFVGDDIVIPEVPMDEARRALLGLFRDYWFVNEADLSRTLAALICAIAIRGNLFGSNRVPMFLFEADQSQAGKTKLLKVIAGVLGEIIAAVDQRKGGVGSFDEGFDAALQRGLSIVLIENLRDALDSQHLETFITWDMPFSTRTPHRKWVTVDPLRYMVLATSNGFQTTADLRNRMIRARVRKRPKGYPFKNYSEGSLEEHARANFPYYLGCGIAILRPWVDAGRPRTNESRHDLRDSVAALDWIIRNGFPELPRLMDDSNWDVELESDGDSSDSNETL